jgi:UDP-N-acetylmuramoyl-tripeptide--D-alanyl-D-alanine ligase
VLSTTFKTHYTKGNLNNHIGIPLTLLEMPRHTEIAVIEMGANHRKEIESYCAYVEPTHGIITNVGKAHLEGFGGEKGIQLGKGELYDYLKKHDGKVFVNGDDAVLTGMVRERKFETNISYGSDPSNTYSGTVLQDHPALVIQFENAAIRSQLYGSYNYSNIMCAVAVGKFFGVPNDQIQSAIEQYVPSNARSQVVQKDGYEVILDSYNANPTSMQHALESFSKETGKRKVVILGDMFELGEEAAKEHQFIADLCSVLKFDLIVLVGREFSNVKAADDVLKFETAIEASRWFRQQQFTNARILLKGSRSMGMEKVIESRE